MMMIQKKKQRKEKLLQKIKELETGKIYYHLRKTGLILLDIGIIMKRI